MSLARYRREIIIMLMKYIKRLSIFIFLFFIIPSFVMAGEPTDRIKVASDKIIAIVFDDSLKTPEMKSKREQMVNEIVGGLFDWQEFSRRTLARHWSKRTEDEKKEFISLFRQLVERTYMAKAGQYSGGKVVFLDEKIEGDYCNVSTQVLTSEGSQISVEYRVIKKDGVWWVYDVYIEGVSLVSNYRSQFNDILVKSSFEDLLKRLKDKIEKEE
jgi:phospholipid transport system substrate-binding protein